MPEQLAEEAKKTVVTVYPAVHRNLKILSAIKGGTVRRRVDKALRDYLAAEGYPVAEPPAEEPGEEEVG